MFATVIWQWFTALDFEFSILEKHYIGLGLWMILAFVLPFPSPFNTDQLEARGAAASNCNSGFNFVTLKIFYAFLHKHSRMIIINYTYRGIYGLTNWQTDILTNQTNRQTYYFTFKKPFEYSFVFYTSQKGNIFLY